MINMLGYNISNALRINEPWRLTIEEIMKIGAAIGVDWHELLEGVE